MYQIKLIHDLDLDSTLFSGQAFRWYKKNEWYYGYIKNTFVKLRKYNNCIEYTNSENIKFESEIIEYFDLNNNYYKIFENLDDHNAYLAYKRFKGMKVLNQDPWECLISFIISAWSNVPKISKSINDLSIKLGVEKKIDTEVGHTFPTPGILSDLDEKSLRNFSLGYRAKYVLGTSKLLNNNQSRYGIRGAPVPPSKISFSLKLCKTGTLNLLCIYLGFPTCTDLSAL